MNCNPSNVVSSGDVRRSVPSPRGFTLGKKGTVPFFRVHSRRAVGGYYDHWHFDCFVASGRASGARGGAAVAVLEQPEAVVVGGAPT